MENHINIIDQVVDIQCEFLSLSFFNEVNKNEIKKILQLNRLKHLNLSSSELFDEHLEIICENKQIELLDLDLTEISDNGISYLKSFNNLRELRLKDNPQITDNCIENLLKIKTLEFIHLENTSITISGLKRIFHMPNLNSIIIDTEFHKLVEELLIISTKYLNLKILMKGKALIINGKLI